MRQSREKAWSYMIKCNLFRALDVSVATGMNLPHCQSMISRFKRRGYIETVCGYGTEKSPFIYRAVVSSTPIFGAGNRRSTTTKNRPTGKGREKTKQQMMWNACRICVRFTLTDLLMTTTVSEQHAYWYLIRLERAGYIKPTYKVDTKLANNYITGHQSRYALARDTGSKAPIVRPDGLWDQNEQKFYSFVI